MSMISIIVGKDIVLLLIMIIQSGFVIIWFIIYKKIPNHTPCWWNGCWNPWAIMMPTLSTWQSWHHDSSWAQDPDEHTQGLCFQWNAHKINHTLQWHERHGISHHWQLNCLLNSLLRLITNETSKVCITGSLCRETSVGQWIPHTKDQ